MKGLDSAILQSQLVCLAFVFVTCCITMYRGTAWHNDGWHLPMVAALFFSTCVLSPLGFSLPLSPPPSLLLLLLLTPLLLLTTPSFGSYLKLTSREFQEDFHKR